MFQLLGRNLSRGSIILILKTAIASLFFFYLWPVITASKFLWGMHLNMPHLYYCMGILGKTFMINQILGALWGKCWWENISEENFSFSSSYLGKWDSFILWRLMWDEYRPPRSQVLSVSCKVNEVSELFWECLEFSLQCHTCPFSVLPIFPFSSVPSWKKQPNVYFHVKLFTLSTGWNVFLSLLT